MSLPENKKELLRKFVNYICQRCHKHENEVGKLEIHRIRRGCEGGLYTLNNICVCCKECHKLYHGNEFK